VTFFRLRPIGVVVCGVDPRHRLSRELADRGASLSPLRNELQAAQTALTSMRAEIDVRDQQLATNADLLRNAMSAEKRQTAAVGLYKSKSAAP
jgi:hypothetical protein